MAAGGRAPKVSALGDAGAVAWSIDWPGDMSFWGKGVNPFYTPVYNPPWLNRIRAVDNLLVVPVLFTLAVTCTENQGARTVGRPVGRCQINSLSQGNDKLVIGE
jgi:hypothetical protein